MPYNETQTICTVTLLLALTMILPMAALQTTTGTHTSMEHSNLCIPGSTNEPSRSRPNSIRLHVARQNSQRRINGRKQHPIPQLPTDHHRTRRHNNQTKTWDVVQDTTSSQSYIFTPNQVGTYNFDFYFPGQTYTWNPTNTPGLAANASLLRRLLHGKQRNMHPHT